MKNTQIKPVTKYSYNGREFNSLKEIKDEIHNIIGGEVLDKIVKVCPPQKRKDLFRLLDVLCSPDVRDTLMKCYNVTFEEVDDCTLEVKTINILDI